MNESEIILNCQSDKFRFILNRMIKPDLLTISNLCRNYKEDRFIGNCEKDFFRVSYNKSFLLLNSFSFWTVNELLAPTVMKASIEDLDNTTRIGKITFTKRPLVIFIANLFLWSSILVLIISIINIKNLECPLAVVLICVIIFAFMGLYLLHIPRNDKKRLLDWLNAFNDILE